MNDDRSRSDQRSPNLELNSGALEDMFRAIYEQSSHIMAILDPHGRVRHANRAACDFIKDGLAYLAGRAFWEIDWWGDPGEQRKVRHGLDRALLNGEAVQLDTTSRSADGVLCDIDLTLKPVRDKARRVMWVIAEARDITASKRTQASLREKADELDRYFENALDLLCIVERNGYFRRVNRQWEATLGYSVSELEGTRFLDLVHPGDRHATPVSLEDLGARRSVSDFVSRFRHKDGSYRSIQWRSLPVREIVYVVARDTTYTQGSEEALRDNMRRLRTIVNGAPIILYSFDANGIFTLSQGNALTKMGIPQGDVVGRSVFEVYHDRPDILDNMRRALAGETFTVPVILGDYIFDAYHTPLLDERQGYIGTIGVLVDVTERARAETAALRLQEQLQHAMKMEAVGRLAGGIAHDFNNVLTAIMGNTELARMESGVPPESAHFLSEVSHASESAASLTRQLLAFARKQLIEPRVLNLNDLVQGLETMLTRLIGEDVELQLRLAGDLGVVRVDPGQVEQMLVNLAVNARDAMPNGGKLVIETGNLELDATYCVRHAGISPGGFVVLSVRDTGEGMSDEVKGRLFEPFFTTKPIGRGTGLGLATISAAVKQAGGTIEVDSAVSEGSTFRILLPRTEGQPAQLVAGTPTEKPPRGHGTVLLVENETSVRDLAREILERLGYRVMDAGTGREALSLLDASTERIDLLLTDVVMPGMSGRDLADRLLERRPDIKVLFASGYTGDVVLDHGVVEQSTNFIPKPYTMYSLGRKIREVLHT